MPLPYTQGYKVMQAIINETKPSASKSQFNLKSVNGNNPISVAHLQNPDI